MKSGSGQDELTLCGLKVKERLHHEVQFIHKAMAEISECGFTAIIERGGLYMMQVLRFLYGIFREGGGGGGHYKIHPPSLNLWRFHCIPVDS